jgi:hypothetical protein
MYKSDPGFAIGYHTNLLIDLAFPVKGAVDIEVEEKRGLGIVEGGQVLEDVLPPRAMHTRLVVLVNISEVDRSLGVLGENRGFLITVSVMLYDPVPLLFIIIG